MTYTVNRTASGIVLEGVCFFIFVGLFVVAPWYSDGRQDGRTSCLEEGPRLCSFKADWVEKNPRPILMFWTRATPPWASDKPLQFSNPGFKVPADWRPEVRDADWSAFVVSKVD
jgi:hypothetical protein